MSQSNLAHAVTHSALRTRPLPTSFTAALQALWLQFEQFDLRWQSQLRKAASTMRPALPQSHYAEATEALIASLTDDISSCHFANPTDQLQFRFLGGAANLPALLPTTPLSYIALVPLADPYSYHSTVTTNVSNQLAEKLAAAGTDNFIFIANALASTESNIPLTHQQIKSYERIALTILMQAMAGAMQSMAEQTSLVGALKSIQTAARQLLASLRSYQKQEIKTEKIPTQILPLMQNTTLRPPKIITTVSALPAAPAIVTRLTPPPTAEAIRQNAMQLERGLQNITPHTSHLTSAPPTLLVTMQLALQQLREIRVAESSPPFILQQRARGVAPASTTPVLSVVPASVASSSTVSPQTSSNPVITPSITAPRAAAIATTIVVTNLIPPPRQAEAVLAPAVAATFIATQSAPLVAVMPTVTESATLAPLPTHLLQPSSTTAPEAVAELEEVQAPPPTTKRKKQFWEIEPEEEEEPRHRLITTEPEPTKKPVFFVDWEEKKKPEPEYKPFMWEPTTKPTEVKTDWRLAAKTVCTGLPGCPHCRTAEQAAQGGQKKVDMVKAVQGLRNKLAPEL